MRHPIKDLLFPARLEFLRKARCVVRSIGYEKR